MNAPGTQNLKKPIDAGQQPQKTVVLQKRTGSSEALESESPGPLPKQKRAEVEEPMIIDLDDQPVPMAPLQLTPKESTVAMAGIIGVLESADFLNVAPGTPPKDGTTTDEPTSEAAMTCSTRATPEPEWKLQAPRKPRVPGKSEDGLPRGGKILVEVTSRANTSADRILAAVLGAPRPGIPTCFAITMATKIHQCQKTYDELREYLIPSTILEVIRWQPNEMVPSVNSIQRWPNIDVAEVQVARIEKLKMPIHRLSMITNKTGRLIVDPIQRTLKKLGKQMAEQVQPIVQGKILDVKLVKMPAQTRYLQNDLAYFSKSVLTPIEMNVKTAGRHEVCSMIRVNPKVAQWTELKLDPNNKCAQKTLRDVGRAAWLSLSVIECQESSERTAATHDVEDAKWETNGDEIYLELEIHEKPGVNLKACAGNFTKGALVLIREKETCKSPENTPVTMLIDETNFEQGSRIFRIRLQSYMSLIAEVFKVKTIQELPTHIQISPAMDQLQGRELAQKLMSGKLEMFDEGKPYPPQDLFKAVLKVPLDMNHSRKVMDMEEVSSDWLTDDQLAVVNEIISKKHSAVVTRAVAGAGKTSVIVKAIKELNKRDPSKIPVVTSTSNAPTMHVAEEFADEERPALLFASMIALKKLKPEDAVKMEKLSFQAHIKATMKLPQVTDAHMETLQKALIIEGTLSKEMEKAGEENDRKDMAAQVNVLEDLLGAFKGEGALDYVDAVIDEEETTQIKPAEKTEYFSRASLLKECLKIIILYRPPMVIAGTTAMITRLGSALTGITDTLVIDEAATVSQLSLLGILAEIETIDHITLVGDDKQLQVYSKNIPKEVRKFGNESVLQIMADNTGTGVAKKVLSSTFRFHPALLDMINEINYPELTLTTPITAAQRPGFDQMFVTLSKIPIMLMDCSGKESECFPISTKNDSQTAMAVRILERMKAHGETATVISLYNGQKTEMLNATADSGVIVSSVDGFQGQEDKFTIVILSKTLKLENNNFFNDVQRRTVALTRAQCGLIVLADTSTLHTAPAWRPFLHYCQANLLVHYDLPRDPLDT